MPPVWNYPTGHDKACREASIDGVDREPRLMLFGVILVKKRPLPDTALNQIPNCGITTSRIVPDTCSKHRCKSVRAWVIRTGYRIDDAIPGQLDQPAPGAGYPRHYHLRPAVRLGRDYPGGTGLRVRQDHARQYPCRHHKRQPEGNALAPYLIVLRRPQAAGMLRRAALRGRAPTAGA